MPRDKNALWKGSVKLTTMKRSARCKGNINCDSYKVFASGKGDAWKNVHGIPQGETVLWISNGDREQPLIFCKDCMKKVFAQMEQVLEEAEKLGLRSTKKGCRDCGGTGYEGGMESRGGCHWCAGTGKR